MKSLFSCITLPVEDLARSFKFYKEVLGFVPKDSDTLAEDAVIAPFNLPGGWCLVLAQRTEFGSYTEFVDHEVAQRGASECILSFFLESREAIDVTLDKVRIGGGMVPRSAGEQPWGYVGFFTDPDGHMWEMVWNSFMSNEQTTNEHAVVTGPGAFRFERVLPGPIERVWEYLTDSEKRGKWLASGIMEPRVGGRIELRFVHADLSPHVEETPARFKHIEGGVTGYERVTRFEPPRVLGITWGDGESNAEVIFELSPRGDDVLLVLTHRHIPTHAEMLDVVGGWHTHLAILVDNLNGQVPRPFWATHAKADADYKERIPADSFAATISEAVAHA